MNIPIYIGNAYKEIAIPDSWKPSPCPFCGSSALRVIADKIGVGAIEKDTPCSIRYHVALECAYCNARGPRKTTDSVYDSELVAISVESWNEGLALGKEVSA